MKKQNSELIEARNTLESIWVAIVLAFVLRAFLIEGFVIPTGSMAPRLMGMHVRVVCPDCGYSFPRGVGVTDTGARHDSTQAYCPNCNEDIAFAGDIRRRSGDRVLVLKLPEFMRALERWDVVVFKDPESNSQNFIKRLVGLPGEALRIVHGDLYRLALTDANGDGVLDAGDLPAAPVRCDGWRIVRKDYETQRAIWQLLYDSEYAPADRPERLVSYRSPWSAGGQAPQAWNIEADHGRSWRYDGTAAATLRYSAERPGRFLPTNPYNTDTYNRSVSSYCGDLRLETIVVPDAAEGLLRLVLGSFDHRFAAELNLATGQLALRHIGNTTATDLDWSTAETWGRTTVTVEPGRPLRVGLYHYDFTAGVCIDDKPVLVSAPEQYDADPTAVLAYIEMKREPIPMAAIDAVGGAMTLTRTRLLRDMFYTNPTLYGNPSTSAKYDYARKEYGEKFSGRESLDSWASPTNPIVLRKYLDERRCFDEFFMCGDNSPASHDSRAWTGAAPTLRLYNDAGKPQYRLGTVPRYNLIGKAFFVYWPSGAPLGPIRKVPLAPDVGRMRRIH